MLEDWLLGIMAPVPLGATVAGVGALMSLSFWRMVFRVDIFVVSLSFF